MPSASSRSRRRRRRADGAREGGDRRGRRQADARGAGEAPRRGSRRSTRRSSSCRTSATSCAKTQRELAQGSDPAFAAAVSGLAEALGREDIQTLLGGGAGDPDRAGRHHRQADRRGAPAGDGGGDRQPRAEEPAQDAGGAAARARGHPVRVQEAGFRQPALDLPRGQSGRRRAQRFPARRHHRGALLGAAGGAARTGPAAIAVPRPGTAARAASTGRTRALAAAAGAERQVAASAAAGACRGAAVLAAAARAAGSRGQGPGRSGNRTSGGFKTGGGFSGGIEAQAWVGPEAATEATPPPPGRRPLFGATLWLRGEGRRGGALGRPSTILRMVPPPATRGRIRGGAAGLSAPVYGGGAPREALEGAARGTGPFTSPRVAGAGREGVGAGEGLVADERYGPAAGERQEDGDSHSCRVDRLGGAEAGGDRECRGLRAWRAGRGLGFAQPRLVRRREGEEVVGAVGGRGWQGAGGFADVAAGQRGHDLVPGAGESQGRGAGDRLDAVGQVEGEDGAGEIFAEIVGLRGGLACCGMSEEQAARRASSGRISARFTMLPPPRSRIA